MSHPPGDATPQGWSGGEAGARSSSRRFAWSFGELPLTTSQRRPAAAALRPGEVFAGRYRIESMLGSGGMGHVFRAYEPDLDRRVAIKLLSDVDERRTARFVREGELLAALTHPGIVRVFGGGVTAEGQPFLVMEEVEGAQELDRCLLEAGLEGGLDLLEQVAEAVGYAHAQGVVHRDLKPGNVLVDAEGRARVCDFGLAWREDVDRLTRSGAAVGTPLYMAPEQAGLSGRLEPAPSADVWSLGVMLYQHLTGELPFFGGTLIELMSAIGTTEPSPAHVVDPRVPRALSAVCQRALQREPARRHLDASAFAAHLRAARRGGGQGRTALRRAGTVAAVCAAAGLGAWLGRRPAAAPPAGAAPTAGATAPAAPPAPLAAAEALQAALAPASELYAALARALEAARAPADRGAALLLWARVASERAHHERVLEATRQLLAEAAASSPAAREATFLRGRALVDAGRREEALGVLRGLDGPEDRWGLLGAAAIALAEQRDPLPALARVEAHHPRDPWAALLEAEQRFVAQDPEGEHAALARLGPAGERCVQVLLGEAEYALGPFDRAAPRDLDRAAALLERARRLGAPDLVLRYYAGAARLAALRGDHETSVRLLREGNARRPDPRFAWLLGAELELLGRPREAADAWRAGSAAQPKAFRELAAASDLPRQLRIRRALGELVPPASVLTDEARRWIEGEAARLPAPLRAGGRALLEGSVRGEGWRWLAPRVQPLAAEPAAARLVALVALSRDRLDEAEAALERALGRELDPELSLWQVDLRMRREGLSAGEPALEALLARWREDCPETRVARALLATLRHEPGAVALCDALPLDGPRLTVPARALSLLFADRPEEAATLIEHGFLRVGFADLFLVRLRLHCHRERVLRAPSSTPDGWNQLFFGAEVVMTLTDNPSPRLSAAEDALLLGQDTPWFFAARLWAAEADASEMRLRGRQAEKVAQIRQELRALEALVRGRPEDEVRALYRGLPRGGLSPRGLARYQERFGHPLPPD